MTPPSWHFREKFGYGPYATNDKQVKEKAWADLLAYIEKKLGLVYKNKSTIYQYFTRTVASAKTKANAAGQYYTLIFCKLV